MKLIYTGPSPIEIALFKDLLERQGISCVLKNDVLGGFFGEIPWTEAFPEVWIVNESDLGKAQEVKADWLSSRS